MGERSRCIILALAGVLGARGAAAAACLESNSCDMTAGTCEAVFQAAAEDGLFAGFGGLSVTLVCGSADGTAEASFVLDGQTDAYACVSVTSVVHLSDVWAQLNAALLAALQQSGTVHITDEIGSPGDCTGGLVVIPAACQTDADCADATFCNGAETCVAGTCVDGTAPDCSLPGSPCNEGFCDPATDACATRPADEGGVCDDDDLCTDGDACHAGACAGAPVDCGGDACHVGVCDGETGGCLSEPLPNQPPQTAFPADVVTEEEEVVILQLVATDADGDSLGWSAVGLPPGLAIHDASGIISGAADPGSQGVYLVTVTVSDGCASAEASFTWTVLDDSDGAVCTRTLGYWKNHADAWPASTLVVGGAPLTQLEALDLLETPPRGDATIILARQLIAARLNGEAGADTGAVSDTLAAADAWLADEAIGSRPQGAARAQGIGLAEILDLYNNGLLGPQSCE